MIALQEAEVFFDQDKERLQKLAFEARIKHFGNDIVFYKKPFDPVSITKTRCELSCKHCNTHYLEHMHQVDSSDSLEKLASELSRSGVKGLVVSGGSRRDGSVPTYELKDSLKKVRRETGLKINAHTGILNKKRAHEVSEFIDAALTDVIGDRETIGDVLGLNYDPEEYKKTLHYLKDFGVENISPHIIVGLNYGRISGEFKALELLRKIDPNNIVIVVFIPTEGTEMGKMGPPSVEDVSKVISIARLMYPETNISLSCVRPGGRYRLELDREAIKSGVNKIAVPSRSAYEAAEELGLEIEEIDESRCCSW